MMPAPEAPLAAALGWSDFEPEALACLELAARLAQGSPPGQVSTDQLALAFLRTDDGALDRLLVELFSGLRAETVAASLADMLGLDAAGPSGESLGPEGELPPSTELCDEDCLHLLEEALGRAREAGAGRLALSGLGAALLVTPGPALSEAFGDAGITPAELAPVALRLAQANSTSATTEGVFEGDRLCVERFGSLTRKALAELAGRAASEPTKKLRDADLLSSLLRQEGSRLFQGLHVIGAGVSAFRRLLQPAAAEPAGGARKAGLSRPQMNALLERIFEDARMLAARERSALITESHLVRAHLDRVGSATGNLYERAAIDTRRLRRYLETYSAEPTELVAGGARPAATRTAGEQDLAGFLRSRVLYQERAIEVVLPALKRMGTGLSEPGRPLGKFLFLGPTGVGKTELARAMAEAVFGSGAAAPLIKVDCGKLTERHDIVQLIGARQGLVGYKEGQLTNALATRPESVILFDEAEKADEHIWQSLLGFFDDGTLQEADGTEYDATHCLIVATSNRGYREAIAGRRPFDALPKERDEVWEAIEQEVEASLKTYFSPELLGRFGRENVVFFRHFTRDNYIALVRQQAEKLKTALAARGLWVVLEEGVCELLGGLAFARREEGARPVGRLITLHLRDAIVDALGRDRSLTRFTFTPLAGSESLAMEASDAAD